VDDAPSLRRLAVTLGGLKLLCLLVKATPRKFYAEAGDAEFPEKLWQSAARLNLLESAPQPYLMGKMLMDLGIKPGKLMGEIIKQSFELQLDGKITNAEEAIAWAMDQTKELL
jgi:tRNA nucleotidyltransferase (CCA-adding enzyme)